MDELTDSPAVVEIKMTVYWVRFLSVEICLVIKSNLIENLRLAESPINDFKVCFAVEKSNDFTNKQLCPFSEQVGLVI
uniref:Putative ovule protein n=1 Tax=Solanum chacoense TaxID=4108 RepID=A0A0V0IBQ1_SOLCH